MTLADQIRASLDSKPVPEAYIAATDVLLAVVAKCERMRLEHRNNAAGIADEFEQTIARELGISH